MFLRFLDHVVLAVVRVLIIFRDPYLAAWYIKHSGWKKLPNPALPTTANDKFYWRKMFDHNPAFTRLADKIAVREWLAETGTGITGPEIFWTGTDAATLPDEVIAKRVAVKANHASGANILLREPPKDRDDFNAKANRLLQIDHGKRRAQWAYDNIAPELLAEEFLPENLMEFQFLMFGEKLGKLLMIYDRIGGTYAGDHWTPNEDGILEANVHGGFGTIKHANRPLPENFDEMFALAKTLARDFDHVRVDLNYGGGRVWFGEMTFYHIAGHVPKLGPQRDSAVSRYWDIGTSWFLTTPQFGWRGVYANALRRTLAGRKASLAGPADDVRAPADRSPSAAFSARSDTVQDV